MSGDEVRFTNSHWSFSQRQLCEALGLASLQVMLDTALTAARATRPDRDFQVTRDLPSETIYLKTDAEIQGGSSGGAALDERGLLVGVPTSPSGASCSRGVLS